MTRKPRHIVREWLDAERAGQADQADRHFRSVASALPRFRPSPLFAETILARAGLVPNEPDRWASWVLRGAVAAALLSTGVLVVSLSADAWLSALVGSVRVVAWGFDHTLMAIQAWVGGALTVWSGLAHAAIALGRLLSGPAAIVMLTLNLTVAAVALAALRRLIPLQEY